MIKREDGFTIVELLITMAIFVFIMAAASGVLTGLITQFKQQSKVTETNIEGIVGLEILKQDLEQAGYGLPWNLNGASYREAEVDSLTPWVDRDFNDGPPDNPARGTDPAGASNPPAAVRSGNGYALNGSDVLIIKSVTVAGNDTCQKWTPLSAASPYVRTWTPASENLAANDRVIALLPGTTTSSSKSLIMNGTAFSTTFNNVTSSSWRPATTSATYVVYGVDPGTDLRMPFNRADYYVRQPATGMPSKCAPNTGILYKSVLKQSDGTHTEFPLLDCVADMQVNFWLDTNGDGNVEWPPVDDISGLTASDIRSEVQEVRVYIVAHEGQRDVNYDFSMNGTRQYLSALERLDLEALGLHYSRTVNFINLRNLVGDPEYKHYRWKLYTIVATPNDLR